MSERCPLAGGGMAIESLPDFCRRNCASKWEDALRCQAGEYDDYNASTEDCQHARFEVVHSHEGLQAVDETAKRFYSLVDMCENCQTELYETVYTFECPHN